MKEFVLGQYGRGKSMDTFQWAEWWTGLTAGGVGAVLVGTIRWGWEQLKEYRQTNRADQHREEDRKERGKRATEAAAQAAWMAQESQLAPRRIQAADRVWSTAVELTRRIHPVVTWLEYWKDTPEAREQILSKWYNGKKELLDTEYATALHQLASEIQGEEIWTEPEVWARYRKLWVFVTGAHDLLVMEQTFGSQSIKDDWSVVWFQNRKALDPLVEGWTEAERAALWTKEGGGPTTTMARTLLAKLCEGIQMSTSSGGKAMAAGAIQMPTFTELLAERKRAEEIARNISATA